MYRDLFITRTKSPLNDNEIMIERRYHRRVRNAEESLKMISRIRLPNHNAVS